MIPMLTLVLVALSVLALLHAGPTLAGPVPDAVQLALMRDAVARTPLVRIRGEFGTLQGYRPVLDSSGVRLTQRLVGSRDAMRTSVVNSSEIEPTSWSEISSIETDRAGYAGKSTLVGGLLGCAVAMVIAVSNIDWLSLRDQTHDSDGAIMASIGGGFAIGYLIGQHGKRRSIYPSREARP